MLDVSLWEMRFESPALGIDQKWPYMCIAVGFGLMTLRLAQVYYLWIRHGVPLIPDTVDADADADVEGAARE